MACAVMAYNLSRAVGVLAGGKLGKARTATIRSKLINMRSPVFPGQGISDSYATWCFSNHANSTSLGVIYPNAE